MKIAGQVKVLINEKTSDLLLSNNGYAATSVVINVVINALSPYIIQGEPLNSLKINTLNLLDTGNMYPSKYKYSMLVIEYSYDILDWKPVQGTDFSEKIGNCPICRTSKFTLTQEGGGFFRTYL